MINLDSSGFHASSINLLAKTDMLYYALRVTNERNAMNKITTILMALTAITVIPAAYAEDNTTDPRDKSIKSDMRPSCKPHTGCGGGQVTPK
jgi:hypothetical protein